MNKQQIIVVSAVLALGLSIYFFGKMTVLTQDTTAPVMEASRGMDNDALLEIAASNLKPEEREKLTPIMAALDTVKNDLQKAGLHRSLAAFWDTKSEWAAAGVHYQAAAEADPQAVNYMVAGSRYQAAAEVANDTLLSGFLFNNAISNMEKATQLAPNDLDMKSDLAIVIVTGTAAPMRGIQSLLDIVKQEPKHLKANAHLARLAITSGQHDKAVERYTNLIAWYPAFADAYLGLGEAHFNLGNKEAAIKSLEQYKGLVRDESVNTQIDVFINKIKSSTP